MSEVINFLDFKIPRDIPIKQPVLTSHEVAKNTPVQDLGEFEIAVDNLMTAWYNGDQARQRLFLLDLFNLVQQQKQNN